LSRYAERRAEPGICDFTFGNPHEMPLPGLVEAIRRHAIPLNKDWFAYKTSEAGPQAFLAERLTLELSLPFEPEDIALTNGAFAAISVAFRLLFDVEDEAIFSTPAWFSYEPTHDSPHFQRAPKVSVKTGSSASIVVNRSINGSNRTSGIVGINS
jgi:aspartate aminotransferase